MNNDCVTVDELLLEIADYTNNYQEVAVEKLKRLCSQSYEAYSYLQDRAHDDTFVTCWKTRGLDCTHFGSVEYGTMMREAKRLDDTPMFFLSSLLDVSMYSLLIRKGRESSTEGLRNPGV